MHLANNLCLSTYHVCLADFSIVMIMYVEYIHKKANLWEMEVNVMKTRKVHVEGN